ncbi:MAG: hypothetical protein LW832_02710 [Parachlamydia sp.]|jgi:hypothetical protein|nr:hypothetical protein [Parachlamydia sp.]
MNDINSATAVIYASFASNPIHQGHMAMIARAIEGVKEKNIQPLRVFVSLSHYSYLRNKIIGQNLRIKREKSEGANYSYEIFLDGDALEKFLKAALEEFKDNFQNVPVEFWGDQDEGESDHFESYTISRN